MVEIKNLHGGRRTGAGRKPKPEVNLRARLVELVKLEGAPEDPPVSNKAAISQVAHDFEETYETVRSSVRSLENPHWDLPALAPACQCAMDTLPHWHCQHCQTLLGAGVPRTGLLNRQGEFGQGVVACDDDCRERFLEEPHRT